jgi:membrane protein DedA with SNARE-associated domain
VLKFLHITDERLAKVETQYRESPWKTMIIAKVSYGLGTVFMVASGVSDMPVGSFLWFIGVLNAGRSLILVAIGYYFGRVALDLGAKYFSYYTIAVVVIIGGYFLIKYFRNRKTKTL